MMIAMIYAAWKVMTANMIAKCMKDCNACIAPRLTSCERTNGGMTRFFVTEGKDGWLRPAS